MKDDEVLVIALAEALYWRKQWDDSNPDVGMGPTLPMLLNDILNRTKIKITAHDAGRILAYTINLLEEDRK